MNSSVAFAAKILLHPLSNQLLGDIIGKNEANVGEGPSKRD